MATTGSPSVGADVLRPEDDTGPNGWAHLVHPTAMNAFGVKYSLMQVCAAGHVTAPYAFVNIPDENAAELMQGLRCPHAKATKGFGLCDRATVPLMRYEELLAAYVLGGDEAVTPLLRRYRKRYKRYGL